MTQMYLVSTKKCCKCGLVRPAECFAPDKRTPTGLSAWCRVCSRAAIRDYYHRKRATDGEWLKKRRSVDKARHRARYKDRVIGERMRESNRRCRERAKKTDPAFRERESVRHLREKARSVGATMTDVMLTVYKEGGRCPICLRQMSLAARGASVSLCVDHDHKTGGFRGCVCHSCNLGLGRSTGRIGQYQRAMARMNVGLDHGGDCYVGRVAKHGTSAVSRAVKYLLTTSALNGHTPLLPDPPSGLPSSLCTYDTWDDKLLAGVPARYITSCDIQPPRDQVEG